MKRRSTAHGIALRNSTFNNRLFAPTPQKRESHEALQIIGYAESCPYTWTDQRLRGLPSIPWLRAQPLVSAR